MSDSVSDASIACILFAAEKDLMESLFRKVKFKHFQKRVLVILGAGSPAIQVSATNLTHTFIAGIQTFCAWQYFSCSFNVSQSGTAFSLGSGNSSNTFGITVSSATNCSVTNTSGTLTIDATSDIFRYCSHYKCVFCSYSF